MIAFLTSLRARALASDWAYHVWLLERAVASMLASGGRVVIGCHDVPDSPLAADPRVHFLPVDIPPPARVFDDMCVDKVLKLTAAARWAGAQGAAYLAVSDADDLVTRRLGAFVEAHAGAAGWYADAEFMYGYGQRWVRLERPGRPVPCLIVRADLMTFAPAFTGPAADVVRAGGEAEYIRLLNRHGREVSPLLAAGHMYYARVMEMMGHPLEPLPFPGLVVINHGDSMSFGPGGLASDRSAAAPANLGLRGLVDRARRTARLLPALRPATKRLRAEFSIPADDSIPRRFRAAGAVFWR